MRHSFFRRRVVIIAILLFPLYFTGCIEIRETIVINNDKSGTFSVFIDMSQLKGMLSGAERYVDMSLMSQLKSWPGSMAEKMTAIKGISEIASVSDEESGKYGFSFAFENDRALNKTLYSLMDHKGSLLKPKLYRVKKDKFTKRNIGPILRQVMKRNDDKIMNAKVFDIVDYVCDYSFPSNVISAENKQSKIKNNRVLYRCSVMKLLSEKVNLGNKIKWE